MSENLSDSASIGSALHAFGEGNASHPGQGPGQERVFPPAESFSTRAHIRSLTQYRKLYRESIQRPAAFWGRQGRAELVWFKPWKKVLQWKLPDAKWFVGGRLNASYNCLDRHLGTPTANKAALIWEGEPAGPGQAGEERTLTYQQLHHEVCLFANVLKRRGIQKGDRVIIYLPMVPEAAIAMLACARIGAVHSVVFGGFSAQSVADRIFDCQAKLVITADGGFRRGSIVPLKKNVDEALRSRTPPGNCSPPPSATSSSCAAPATTSTSRKAATSGGIANWNTSPPIARAAKMDSEAPLFILYTSGSTGKPKGILHTTAGYLLDAKLTTR